YWIDLKGGSKSEYFTGSQVHANGPVPQRAYGGVIHWDQDQKRISVNLHRAASASTPFGANGTYVIRKITSGPFMTESSGTDMRESALPLMAAR
ncbi:MAG TPA: hypothetical protein VG347_25445, partial [Verrucomicrobiae bacterium]|nr:hypothetical protein [Verrucomicrobiae bacterium]